MYEADQASIEEMTETENNNEKREQENKSPGFFRVSNRAIRDIATEFKNPAHIAAYIVLSRHAPGWGKLANKVSTAGVKAIADKGNLSRTTAELVLKDLQAVGFIKDRAIITDSGIPLFLGKKQGIGNTIRWVFNECQDNELVFFPNALIDGIAKSKNNPPLCKLMTISGVNGYSPKQIRLDALMVLIKLYYHLELFDRGGVEPMSGIYKKWGTTETSFSDENGYMDDVDDLSFMALDRNSDDTKMYANTDFINSALPHINDDNELKKRFWYAFKEILMIKLGLVYEVLQIWDSNPTENEDAEVLYPLYIFNRHRRETEPSLYKTINNAVIEHFQIIPDYINSNSSNGCDEDMKDKYIYVEHVDQPAYPLSVYRLQYKPNTVDAAKWLEREKNSIYEWNEHISWLNT